MCSVLTEVKTNKMTTGDSSPHEVATLQPGGEGLRSEFEQRDERFSKKASVKKLWLFEGLEP